MKSTGEKKSICICTFKKEGKECNPKRGKIDLKYDQIEITIMQQNEIQKLF